MDLSGKSAVVTGASSGIGAELARLLAARGAHVVLVARRVDRLEALAQELRGQGGTADVVPLDLATATAAAELFARTEGQGRPIDVLINNAGFGTYGAFVEVPWETTARQLQLNVTTVTELAHRFGGAMRSRGRGWILNVSSVGAYGPLPGYATYAAGKSYVLQFSHALHRELKGSGVVVSCLTPGPTQTEFFDVAGHRLPAAAKLVYAAPRKTAERALKALFRGRSAVIPGVLFNVAAALMRLVPGPVFAWMAGRTLPATHDRR